MLTIATWNLENLFRPGADAGPTDEDAYDAKLAALAHMIEQIAPDVLAVQEVGDPRGPRRSTGTPGRNLAPRALHPARCARHPRRLPLPPPAHRRRGDSPFSRRYRPGAHRRRRR